MFSQKFIIGLLIFIISFHALAMVEYWYWTYTWFDMLMHFLGGFWVALLFFNLNSKINFLPKLSNNSITKNLITIILTLGFVALIAVFWEFFEFLYDVFISSRGYFYVAQLSAADTVSDLFFGLLGGLTAVITVILKKFNN